MPERLTLVLNCGSSSIKYAALDFPDSKPRYHGLVENIGSEAVIHHASLETTTQQHTLGRADHDTALRDIFNKLNDHGISQQLQAVGHRVVHGGEHFKSATRITPSMLKTLNTCESLAPLHNPANLAGIRIAEQQLPQLAQVAVFDTAFHQTLPEYAYLYALPYTLYREHHIRRYGFHGTSHRYVSEKAAELLGLDYQHSRWISAHLGNGASATAILNGQSVDTTMGFTPLEGLVMGTRSGSLDPGLLLHLMKAHQLSEDELNTLLNQRSGLLGISEISMDMRTLKAQQAEHPQAKLAIDIFCYQLAKHLASLMVPLGHIDGLIFTGGIGENDPQVRTKTLNWLSYLNFAIDEGQNAQHGQENQGVITEPKSCPALVVKTQEEWMIAKETWQCLENISR